MAYQFHLNWPYSHFPMMNYLDPGFGFHSIHTFQSYRQFFSPVISREMEDNEREIQLALPIDIIDRKENHARESELQQSEKIKKNRTIKMKNKSRNVQKELESAKKNCESNLVNQFLSYFSSYSNSSPFIIRALRKMNLQSLFNDKNLLEQTVSFFCKQVSVVNSRKQRKYVNKSFLQNYFFELKLQKYMPDILQNVAKTDLMTKSQFCELFRRCCFHFFRTVSVSSVTSSAKLNPISRPQHIKRRRLIVESLAKK